MTHSELKCRVKEMNWLRNKRKISNHLMNSVTSMPEVESNYQTSNSTRLPISPFRAWPASLTNRVASFKSVIPPYLFILSHQTPSLLSKF